MDRREFLVKGAWIAAALTSPSGRAIDTPVLDLTVGTPDSLAAVSPGFLGLGYEISAVSRRGLMSPANKVYVQLLQNLGRNGVIRVGGNTADYSRYTSLAPAVSAPRASVVSDAVLQDLGGFLEATGWKLIWALNAGSGSEQEAVAEARAVTRIAGECLLAFEIGNEPDLFSGEKHRPPGYEYEDWLRDYRRYKTALRAVMPAIPFAGPDVAGKTAWVTRFAEDEGKDAVLLTHHYYREGQNPGSTIQKLLGVDPKLQAELDQLHAASRTSGLPYRICEVNSFSGGGRPGVSDTMASALWALDYLFRLASNGCSGVNMETDVNQLGFISSYSPIGDDEQGHYKAKPEYYGLLAFAMFGQGTLLPTQISPKPAGLTAHATRPRRETTLLTLINKGDEAYALRLALQSGRDVSTNVIRLTGPAIDATSGITLGGAQVLANGAWKPASRESLPLRRGQRMIHMPAASAAFVEIQHA